MNTEHPNKMMWFANQEKIKKGTFINGIKYKDIIKWDLQQELSFDDFSECDTGYCGI